MAAVIDTVLFDLGQVLVRWDPYRPYVGRYERDEVERFFEEIDFPAFNHLQDAGRTWAEARSALAGSHPHRVPMLDVYIDHFAQSLLGEVEGASDLVDELQRLGLRVIGLTNWPAESFHLAARGAPVVGRLDDVLVSGREGVAKPDPAFFRLAADRFGIEPGRALFTDDLPGNVDSAARCGFHVELFTSTPALRARLAGLGVAVRADGDPGPRT